MQKNSTILGKLWLEAGTDFQQRVPNPTQAGYAASMAAIFDPMNNDIYNEFAGLINRIGMAFLHNRRFENPLAVFKKGSIYQGKTVQETAAKWVKAHAYNDATETLLKMERPEFAVCFHTVNRRDRYPWTIVRHELQYASADPDGYGINELIASVAIAAENSDNYDEMICMLNTFEFADKYWPRGLFKHHLTAAPTDEASAKELLKAVRTYAKRLKFPSQLYNSVDAPTFARMNECVLLMLPDASAAIDVDALASVFNLDKADMQMRTVEVPYIPIDGAVAVLTTEDWFQCYDSVYTVANAYNAETLADKYYLHHQSIISASPVVPCIVFTTDAGTDVPTVSIDATGLQLTAPDSVEIGGTAAIAANLTGSVTENADGIVLAPDSVTWRVELAQGAINSRTYVDRFGVLHLQKSGVEDGDTVTVTAVSTYENPDGATAVLTATATLDVIDPQPEGDFLTVSYNVTVSGATSAPSDAINIPDQVAEKGSTVTLAAKPRTAWTTKDGTPSGQAGTWTFAGWSLSSSVDSTITTVPSIQTDTTVHGKWTFTAS